MIGHRGARRRRAGEHAARRSRPRRGGGRPRRVRRLARPRRRPTIAAPPRPRRRLDEVLDAARAARGRRARRPEAARATSGGGRGDRAPRSRRARACLHGVRRQRRARLAHARARVAAWRSATRATATASRASPGRAPLTSGQERRRCAALMPVRVPLLLRSVAGDGARPAPHALLPAGRVAAAHRRGVPVLGWTANDPATVDRLLAAGRRRNRHRRPGVVVSALATLHAAVKRAALRRSFRCRLRRSPGSFSGAVIADVTTSTGTTTVAATTTAVDDDDRTTTTVARPRRRPRPGDAAGRPDGRARRRRPRSAGLAPADAVSRRAARVQRAARGRSSTSCKLLLDPTKVASAYAATAVAKARISDAWHERPARRRRAWPGVRAWVANVAKRVRSQRRRRDAEAHERQPDHHAHRSSAARSTRRSSTRARHGHPARELTPGRARAHRGDRSRRRRSVSRRRPTIVINREQQPPLPLRRGRSSSATFAVATGQSIYPTPKGTWHIVVKWKNPWWYPPTQDAGRRASSPCRPAPRTRSARAGWG